MTKIIATMALAGLLLATLACRTAEVVERPPTVTPRPSFDSFNYPTNVPTPTPDYEAISRLISEARGTFVPATLRPATRVRPTPDGLEEDCEILVDTVAIMRRTGASDQEVMDALLSSGMVSSEGARALAARCEVDLGDAVNRPPPVAAYTTPTPRECEDIKGSVALARRQGQSDQEQYDDLTDSTLFTEDGADKLLRQAGECGVRLDATPMPRHAEYEVFQ